MDKQAPMHGREFSAGSLNYEYALHYALGAPNPRPRVLDYGCGQGRMVAMGLARGLDIYGVDAYGGHYQDWQQTVPPEIRDRIAALQKGRIPFADASFDVVVSNQVFEHMPAPIDALIEIARVLKPGGVLLAIFPHAEVWFEGHVGLYFAHWLARRPGLQKAYLVFCHRIGLGYFRDGGTTAWQHILRAVTFYHRRRDIEEWWMQVFGSKPQSLAPDWMAFRIAASRRIAWLAPIARQRWAALPLGLICHMRAGLVLQARKRAEPAA
jgi:SAM-dependent methyltransferase